MRKGGDAARGEPDACLSVGNYYRKGYGVGMDSAAAFSWYEKAADKKSWEAMLKLSQMCRDGEGVDVDLGAAQEWAKKAIEELMPLAENGLAEAQRGLGDCYLRGWGVEQSNDLAFKWYSEAYDGRDWLGATRLAQCYTEGIGVAQNFEQAKMLLEKAAVRFCGEALNNLGECYENGNLGNEKDSVKAFDYYRKSASEGNAGGLYNVGRCCLNGIGTERNLEQAEMWLKLAAVEKGDFYSYNKKAEELLKEVQNA
jgi:TPR repeat protein